MPALKPRNSNAKMGLGMLLAMWLLIFALLAWFFSGVLDHQNNPNQTVSSQYLSDQVVEVVLQRNRYGHYLSTGIINKKTVEFMLDTGASGVVVPGYLAAELGLKKGQPVMARTANGTIKAYSARLDRVSIGDISLQDVKALINPDEKSEIILLGMSFLKQIEFTQRGDTLILRQYLKPR
ncbi:MAG: TIGR02281 family clan AA aspartic protease [Gammaproteobacteria bacterium]|nr:TIGR02281 family clan AA aspartic protease [Gammaproteobacteria bacterium]